METERGGGCDSVDQVTNLHLDSLSHCETLVAAGTASGHNISQAVKSYLTYLLTDFATSVTWKARPDTLNDKVSMSNSDVFTSDSSEL